MNRTFDSLCSSASSLCWSRAARAMRVVVLGALASIALIACSDNPVGRICDLGLKPGEAESVVASPSLDCVSRTCLRVPQQVEMLPKGSSFPKGNNGLCTAECEGDDDCDRVPESPCKTGFTCGIPVVVGPFCCKKFCICKDYIVLPAKGKLPEPDACNADNPANLCCNLPDRAGKGICK